MSLPHSSCSSDPSSTLSVTAEAVLRLLDSDNQALWEQAARWSVSLDWTQVRRPEMLWKRMRESLLRMGEAAAAQGLVSALVQHPAWLAVIRSDLATRGGRLHIGTSPLLEVQLASLRLHLQPRPATAGVPPSSQGQALSWVLEAVRGVCEQWDERSLQRLELLANERFAPLLGDAQKRSVLEAWARDPQLEMPLYITESRFGLMEAKLRALVYHQLVSEQHAAQAIDHSMRGSTWSDANVAIFATLMSVWGEHGLHHMRAPRWIEKIEDKVRWIESRGAKPPVGWDRVLQIHQHLKAAQEATDLALTIGWVDNAETRYQKQTRQGRQASSSIATSTATHKRLEARPNPSESLNSPLREGKARRI